MTSAMPLPDGMRVEQGAGGLERLVISAAGGEAHVHLHGANVTHFQPRGTEPVLFLSEKSLFEAGSPGKPIRGGIPICFPWFGPRANEPAAPLHGFARLLTWQIESASQDGDDLRARLVLRPDSYTRQFYAPEFTTALEVRVGGTLGVVLEVRNGGEVPIRFEEALHTYFRVGDVRQARIGGLDGAGYVDKVDGFARKVASGGELLLEGETDRVFLGTQGDLTITDGAWRRRIRIAKEGSATSVVWNPWQAKAQSIPDLEDRDWTSFVCVEAANALDDTLSLDGGATHRLGMTVSVEPD